MVCEQKKLCITIPIMMLQLDHQNNSFWKKNSAMKRWRSSEITLQGTILKVKTFLSKRKCTCSQEVFINIKRIPTASLILGIDEGRQHIQNIIDHEFNWGKGTQDKMCKHIVRLLKEADDQQSCQNSINKAMIYL